MARPSRFSPEVRERAVQMVFGHADHYDAQQAAITSIAEKVGAAAATLRHWVRQAEAGIERSVGSRSDSYDNTLAESVIGLYKTELVHRRGPRKGHEDVEFATLTWVTWYKGSRLHESRGYIPPGRVRADVP